MKLPENYLSEESFEVVFMFPYDQICDCETLLRKKIKVSEETLRNFHEIKAELWRDGGFSIPSMIEIERFLDELKEKEARRKK